MKNSHTTKNYDHEDGNSQNQDTDPKSTGPKDNPYDPENPRKEPQRHNREGHREGLIENAPSEGSQTDMDTQRSDEDESNFFF
jgi:hypothetical protein